MQSHNTDQNRRKINADLSHLFSPPQRSFTWSKFIPYLMHMFFRKMIPSSSQKRNAETSKRNFYLKLGNQAVTNKQTKLVCKCSKSIIKKAVVQQHTKKQRAKQPCKISLPQNRSESLEDLIIIYLIRNP
jgi:hypothetical protein